MINRNTFDLAWILTVSHISTALSIKNGLCYVATKAPRWTTNAQCTPHTYCYKNPTTENSCYIKAPGSCDEYYMFIKYKEWRAPATRAYYSTTEYNNMCSADATMSARWAAAGAPSPNATLYTSAVSVAPHAELRWVNSASQGYQYKLYK